MPAMSDRRFAWIFALATLTLASCSRPAPQVPVPAIAVDRSADVPAPRQTMLGSGTSTTSTESPIARLLRQLDRNGDGRASREEHADVASQMFHAMDTDHDGEVTATEMDAIRRDLYGADRTAAAREIAQVDSNHDGLLSAEEHAASTAVIFDQIDRDHDGFLTLDELKAADAAVPAPTSQ